MKTVNEVYSEIETAAVKNAAATTQSGLRIEAIKVGQAVRQGDIYIHCVPSNHAHGALRRGREARQLAVGQSHGARHLALFPAIVYGGTTLPSTCNERTFLGPCVISMDRFVVAHPEHAHISLPAGAYQVTHQMDAMTLDRVRD